MRSSHFHKQDGTHNDKLTFAALATPGHFGNETENKLETSALHERNKFGQGGGTVCLSS